MCTPWSCVHPKKIVPTLVPFQSLTLKYWLLKKVSIRLNKKIWILNEQAKVCSVFIIIRRMFTEWDRCMQYSSSPLFFFSLIFATERRRCLSFSSVTPLPLYVHYVQILFTYFFFYRMFLYAFCFLLFSFCCKKKKKKVKDTLSRPKLTYYNKKPY